MTPEQKEKWWASLHEIVVDVFTEADVRELSMMLSTTVMKRALAIVLNQVPNFAASLLKTDLTTDEGIQHAQRMQSQAGGIVRAVELLGDLTLEEQKDKEETDGQ
jgi:hypothetical protein